MTTDPKEPASLGKLSSFKQDAIRWRARTQQPAEEVKNGFSDSYYAKLNELASNPDKANSTEHEYNAAIWKATVMAQSLSAISTPASSTMDIIENIGRNASSLQNAVAEFEESQRQMRAADNRPSVSDILGGKTDKPVERFDTPNEPHLGDTSQEPDVEGVDPELMGKLFPKGKGQGKE